MGPEAPISAMSVSAKRAVIFSTRLRFSPQIQEIREKAADKIIESGFMLTESEHGLSEEDLEHSGALAFSDGYLALSHHDIHESVARLVKNGRLIIQGTTPPWRYRLSSAAQEELRGAQKVSEERLRHIIDKVFPHVDRRTYEQPFWDLLFIIFSQLGETYARCLYQEVSREHIIGLPSMTSALGEIEKRYPDLDHNLFREAVFSFFRLADPDYDALKFNLAQNYYIAKALGFDPSGAILSQNLFGGAVFYLDTNVIIPALEPAARHHKSFQVLRRACDHLGIEVRVCQVSLDELRNVVQGQRELISKVAGEIPDALAPKVRGVFFSLYRQQMEESGTVDLDRLFARFEEPGTTLRESYQIETVDTQWFDDALDVDPVQGLAERIRQDSVAKRAWRPKRRGAALHDALLMEWVKEERANGGRNVWILTLDHLLPAIGESAQPDGAVRPLAITLDALLQWMSPLAAKDDFDEGQFAGIFGEAVKYMLLPQDAIFDVQDFAVFAQLELDCKLLPPDDVEGCLRMIKAEAPNLNPADAEDREKLAYRVQRYFTSPGRKFKQALEAHEAEKESVRRHAREELSAAEKQRQADIARYEEEIKSIKSIVGTERQERQKDRNAAQQQRLCAEAYGRLGWCVALLIFLLGIALALVLRFEEADNDYLKVKQGAEFFALTAGIWLILCWFVMGSRERLRALGWPLSKILKDSARH